MPISQVDRIVRVTWSYNLNDVDTSEHSVTYRASAVPTDADTINAVLNDMANAALAAQAADVTPSHWGSGISAVQCRVALEQTNGHTLFEKIVPATGALAWTGSGSGRQLPYEDAFCVSIYAYQPGNFDPAGKYKRGRFYLPPPTADVLDSSNSGLLDATAAADMAKDWAQVLKELQEHLYSGFPTFTPILGVNSRHTVSFSPAVAIRWDNKMDRQVRRQKQQPAAVAWQVFPTP